MNKQLGAIAHSGFPDDDNPANVDPNSPNAMERVVRSLQYFSTAAEGLRFLGAVVLLASMSVFLLQGWNQHNDISRYWLLLSQTGLLTLCGFALSHGLKETKGARIFFGLALVSIPANFTILSALLYSVFQWDGALGIYPEYATWRITDLASTGFTVAGAMAVLVPVTLFCFAVMARHSAKMLSVHFLLINCLLLLPIRSSSTVGMVAIFATVYALMVGARLTARDRNLKTAEGKFALSILFIPIGVILFRSMYFYQVDSLLVAMLSITLFLIARQAAIFPGRNALIAKTLDTVSLVIAMVAAISLTAAVDHVVSRELLALVFAASFAVLAIDIIRRTSSPALGKIAGFAVSALTCTTLVFNVAVNTEVTTAFACLVAGIAMGLVGHAYKDRFAMVAAAITAAAGLVIGLEDLLEMIMGSSWVELGIFGASAIVFGSVLDRHGAALKLRFGKWLAALRATRRRQVHA